MTIKEIYDTYKTIAVYGMSTNASKPSNYVPVFLQSKGYKIIPVNPVADTIAGEKAYKFLKDIPDEIDILNVFRPSAACLEVVEEAIERKKLRGDIKLIWLQLGIANEQAKALAESNGIEFVQNMCMKDEFNG